MNKPAALSIQQLSKSFGDKRVVDSLSFEIEPGEVFGLLGPNGAGKSTTINMISGVSHLGGGSISVFGHDVVKDYLTTRRLTGVMHQEVVVDVFFNIEQALDLHEGYYGVRPDPKWKKMLVDALALGPFLKMRTNQLSGGTKRRFMVAKALVHKPRLLILDEPTAGVDVELRHNLWDFVREVNRQGTTVLLTTHYLEEAEEMCGRIAIMNKGKVVKLDRTRKLLQELDQKSLVVRLTEALSAVPESLRAFAPKLVDDGRALQFDVGAKQSTPQIVHALEGSGLAYQDLETKLAKLEDVFLKFTRGERN